MLCNKYKYYKILKNNLDFGIMFKFFIFEKKLKKNSLEFITIYLTNYL